MQQQLYVDGPDYTDVELASSVAILNTKVLAHGAPGCGVPLPFFPVKLFIARFTQSYPTKQS